MYGFSVSLSNSPHSYRSGLPEQNPQLPSSGYSGDSSRWHVISGEGYSEEANVDNISMISCRSVPLALKEYDATLLPSHTHSAPEPLNAEGS